MEPLAVVGAGVIFVVIILNFVIMSKHIGKAGRSKGRKYKPPNEATQAQWRDKEIARRLEREQDDALERVTLKNETLSYYELVRQKYAKKEALERLGIKVDDDKLDEVTSITSEGHELRDVRDDIYVLDDSSK